jgi:hypothetical protein
MKLCLTRLGDIWRAPLSSQRTRAELKGAEPDDFSSHPARSRSSPAQCGCRVGAGVLTSQLEGRVRCPAPQPDRRSHARPGRTPGRGFTSIASSCPEPAQGGGVGHDQFCSGRPPAGRSGLDMQVRAPLPHRSGAASLVTSVASEGRDRDESVVNQHRQSMTPTSMIRVPRHNHDVAGDRRIDLMRLYRSLESMQASPCVRPIVVMLDGDAFHGWGR